MEKTNKKPISLVKYALYLIIVHFVILFSQAFLLLKRHTEFIPSYLGPFYLPSLISTLMLILLIAVCVFTIKQSQNRETSDELANLNIFKAGHISKYILGFIIMISILLIKDFNFLFTDDIVDNILRIFIIVNSISEIIQHSVFIYLEKKDSSLE